MSLLDTLLKLPDSARNEASAADKAIALIGRLRCFSIEGKSMPIARLLAETLAPLATASDPDAILIALQDLERELLTLGAAPDPVLADGVAVVASGFPGAKLVEVQ
jgi:hypothetical protein